MAPTRRRFGRAAVGVGVADAAPPALLARFRAGLVPGLAHRSTESMARDEDGYQAFASECVHMLGKLLMQLFATAYS